MASLAAGAYHLEKVRTADRPRRRRPESVAAQTLGRVLLLPEAPLLRGQAERRGQEVLRAQAVQAEVPPEQAARQVPRERSPTDSELQAALPEVRLALVRAVRLALVQEQVPPPREALPEQALEQEPLPEGLPR